MRNSSCHVSPLVVLVYLLVVLVSPLVILASPLVVFVCPFLCPFVLLVCPLVVLVCPLVVSVCPLVVPAVLPVGLFITDLRNLFINYLNLITVNSEAAAHQADVLRNRCSLKFRNVQRKHLCWSLFLIKLQACNFPVNIAKFLRTAFPIKHLRGCFWKIHKFPKETSLTEA